MRTEKIIDIKSPEELTILREGGRILSQIVGELKSSLKSGISTLEVDDQAQRIIKKYNVISAFKGYRGFPGCICISVNQEVVHGIPSQRVLQQGDIVSLDVGVIYQGYYTDAAFTIGIEKIKPDLQKLLDVTFKALYKGIEQARVNNHLSDISYAVQKYVESHHFSIVRDFVGHGIGKNLHEEPEIPNFGPPHNGPLLKAGMVLAIEPMVNFGGWQTKILNDGWTVETQDGLPSAHFEHTIAIAVDGPEILTE